MKHLLLLLITFACSGSAWAGFSVVVAPQQQEFTTVNGPYGSRTWPSAEKPQMVRAGQVEVCRSIPWNIFSADPAVRTIVYADPVGNATSNELFAACPSIRNQKAAEIRAEGELRLASLANPYQPYERETWATQFKEAEAWLADPAADVPMITEIAKGRGLAITELVTKIMENVGLFRSASGAILGQQQFLLDWIYREQDFATLITITWE